MVYVPFPVQFFSIIGQMPTFKFYHDTVQYKVVFITLPLILKPPLSALDAGDIALLKTYGVGPYTNQIKQVEADIQSHVKKVNELIGKIKVYNLLNHNRLN